MARSSPMVVVHVPHAATAIPRAMARRLSISGEDLARELLAMTDRYTDELFALPPQLATMVIFPVSRLVVDPERFEDDAREPMARQGMGVIYTRTSDGRELRPPPSPAEREVLLERFYRPHHRRLEEAVDAALASHGRCLIIDGHSFPSHPLPYEDDQRLDRPQICVGTDPDHTPDGLQRVAVEALACEGFRIAVDRPFSGAIVPMKHYRHTSAVESLMIEVNRELYMDEGTGDPRSSMPELGNRLERGLRRLIERYAVHGGGERQA